MFRLTICLGLVCTTGCNSAIAPELQTGPYELTAFAEDDGPPLPGAQGRSVCRLSGTVLFTDRDRNTWIGEASLVRNDTLRFVGFLSEGVLRTTVRRIAVTARVILQFVEPGALSDVVLTFDSPDFLPFPGRRGRDDRVFSGTWGCLEDSEIEQPVVVAGSWTLAVR